MKKKLSITDIANHLGISVTTVSFIINNKGEERRISPSLIRRVQDYVKKVGYVSNQATKLMQQKKGRVIAILVSSYDDVFESQLAEAMRKAFETLSFHTITYCYQESNSETLELPQLITEGQISGFVIPTVKGYELLLKFCKNNQLPVVLYKDASTDFPSVAINEKESFFKAVQTIVQDNEIKRIGLVTLNANDQYLKDRIEGYMDAVDQVGKDVLLKKIHPQWEEEERIAQIKDFLSDNRLDAVCFAKEDLALLGLKVIKQNHLAINKVIAVGAGALFSLAPITVLAIQADFNAYANTVTAILSNLIAQKTIDSRNVCLDAQLINC